MNSRTKKIFALLELKNKKDDVYEFNDDSDHNSDPYVSDGSETEYIPSSVSESSCCSFSSNISTLEEECSVGILRRTAKKRDILNDIPPTIEDNTRNNDVDGDCIFNEENLTCIENSLSAEGNKETNEKTEKSLEIYESPYLIKNKYKRTKCTFCDTLVISKHFSRHLERRHSDERQVRELLNYKSGSKEKKQLLSILRNEGNLDDAIRGNIIPKKRKFGENIHERNFAICPYCKGFYRRLNLSRHVKKCFAKNSKETNETELRPLANSLIFSACTKKFGEFLNRSTVKKEIFSKMQPDEITKEAIQDVLVVHFGEDLLKKSKLKRKIYHISNKLRECGKFLLEMKKFQCHEGMISILRPENLDDCLAAVRSMSRFDPVSRCFGAPSLALHFRTTLTALCDLASKLILRKIIPLPDDDIEKILTDFSRFKNLVDSQWCTEIGSLALKDLNEKGSIKPKVLPVTEDIIKLVNLVNKNAEEAYEKLKKSKNIDAYKILVETTLVATILHNRKRVGDVQYFR